MADVKTKRVRVLVAIDEHGKYSAFAGTHRNGTPYSDEDCRECIFLAEMSDPFIYVWLEADVPIPEPTIIQADVVQVNWTC